MLVLATLAGACAQDKPAAAPARPAPYEVTESIVMVHADGIVPDVSSPWSTGTPWNRATAGLVVGDHGILVAGWGLRNQRHVQIQRLGTTERTKARVVAEDDDAGLTLLTVDDPAFWAAVRPATLSESPMFGGQANLLHAVSDNGDRLETTGVSVAGVQAYGRAYLLDMKVSGIDIKHVEHSDVLASGTHVLGLIHWFHKDDSALLAVSSATLATFLADARSGAAYRGFPVLGVHWQSLRNVTLRDELGLAPNEGGVRVARIGTAGSAHGSIAVGDVLLSIDGHAIASDGTCDVPPAGRVPFEAALTGRRPGDVVTLGIKRAGADQSVETTLVAAPGAADLVPWYPPADHGSIYAMEGGLVFESLSAEYLQTSGKDWETHAPAHLLETYWLDRLDPTPERAHVVVLTRVLADPATLGYEHDRDLIVESINGVRLRSLADVNEAFAHPAGAFDVVTFAPGQSVRRIVLDAKEARAASGRIAATYGMTRGGQ